jgi:hypothetical protein
MRRLLKELENRPELEKSKLLNFRSKWGIQSTTATMSFKKTINTTSLRHQLFSSSNPSANPKSIFLQFLGLLQETPSTEEVCSTGRTLWTTITSHRILQE